MKAKVLKDFYDAKEEQLRLVGEVFELSPARFDEILKRGGLWVEEFEDKLPDEDGKTDGDKDGSTEEEEDVVEDKAKSKAGAKNGGKK